MLLGFNGLDGLDLRVKRLKMLGYGWLNAANLGELLVGELGTPLLLCHSDQLSHIFSVDIFERCSVVHTVLTRVVQCKWVETLIKASAYHENVGTLNCGHQWSDSAI